VSSLRDFEKPPLFCFYHTIAPPGLEGREQRAKGKGRRVKGKEHGAKSKEQSGWLLVIGHWLSVIDN